MFYICTSYDPDFEYDQDSFLVESEVTSAEEIAKQLYNILFEQSNGYKEKLNCPYNFIFLDSSDGYGNDDYFTFTNSAYKSEPYRSRFVEIKKVTFTVKI